MDNKLKKTLYSIDLPRMIIIGFFLMLLISAKLLGLPVLTLLSDTIRRWGMNGILVLAMIPSIQCGIGLNFGISLGIVSGLLGSCISIQMGIANPWVALFVAIAFGILFSAIFGAGYGILLNRVKGSEMTVSTYVGFSIIAFMNIMWLSLPFKNGDLIWPIGQIGMRNTISLSNSFDKVLNNCADFTIAGANTADNLLIPTGLVLFFLVLCVIMFLFNRSKLAIAMKAAGTNPIFAKASGINVNRMRILGTTISTCLGAIGIIVYAQSFGFLQLYNAPLWMGFHCAAAILIGGATISKAKISHVLLGTFLFQGILAVALPVANEVIQEGNISDVIRIIISNGIILYALSRSKGGKNAEQS